ncbi:hypothetical protein [Profundibacter amoris]|nr:hypothetical protein [Profundibacter amoris]
MIRLILILLLLCLPIGATAQKIVVRSGEHGDFSRLAFSFLTPVEWKMGRVSGGYEIRLKGNGNVIDTSSIFRRIPRDRIKDISVSEDKSIITLTVDCACHADAFEFRPGLLVVDIKDGLPAQNSPFETAFSADETGAAITEEMVVTIADEAVKDADETGKESELITEDVSTIDQEAEPVSLPVPAYSSSFTSGLALRPEVGSENSERITMMQSEMLRQIGRAAAQGLLEANLPEPIHEPKPTDTHESMVDPSETQQEAPKEPTAQAHINIHIENSVDREIARLLPRETDPGDGESCLGSDMVNVVEWGGEDAVWEQISQQRRKLSGEFDKVNPVAAEALAKAYIYAGFGAEALQIIDSFDVDPETALILKDIARIVDGLPPQPNGALQGQAACDSEVALWAVLALAELSKGTDVNRPRVIATFSELPLHLRRFLGPKLAEMFLEIGDIETATAIRNAIARAPGDAGDEFRLMEAHFEQERGHYDTAEQTLEEIATDNNAVALKALIKLLEAKAERKSQVSDGILTTAESYLFEQRTTADGAKLLRSLTLIYAQSGNLDVALSNLRAANTNAFINEKVQLWEEVLTTATNSASDEAFLKFIYAAHKDVSKLDIPQATRQAIAKRLLDLGFSTRALDFLNAPVPPSDTDRLIMARAALLDGRADQVESLLENVAGDEAVNLRAQAFENLGDYENAAAAYAEISDYDSQKSAIWQAGDWQSLQQIGTEPEKSLARSMALGAKIVDADPAMSEQVLSIDASLIEESGNFRQSIEALIKDYPAPLSVDE